MENNELRELLQANVYIIRQHLNLLDDETEKALPLKILVNNYKALKDIGTDDKQHNKDYQIINENNMQEEPTVKAGTLLIEQGLLVDSQVRHFKNRSFLEKCDEFIEEYGPERFNNVLQRIKKMQENGVKIGNIYGYINRALDNEGAKK